MDRVSPVVKAGLELLIFLPPTPKYQDYRYVSPHPANTFSIPYKATSLRYFILATTKMSTVGSPYLTVNAGVSHLLFPPNTLHSTQLIQVSSPFLLAILLVFRVQNPRVIED